MISKSNNLNSNRKLTIRRFQRNQNYQISPYILGVIALKSQHPNSDWKITTIGQTLNWRVKCWWNFTNQIFTEGWVNKESNETKIEWFGIKIREKLLLKN